MDIISKLVKCAKENPQRIVLPEGTEERTMRAADRAIADGMAHIILIGNPTEILELAEKYGLGNISKAKIVDPLNNPMAEEYAVQLAEIRKKKGLTLERARELVKDPLYLGCMIIKTGGADGQLAGARRFGGGAVSVLGNGQRAVALPVVSLECHGQSSSLSSSSSSCKASKALRIESLITLRNSLVMG